MIYDLVITGGIVITDDGPKQQQIAIKNEKIQRLASNNQKFQALEYYRAEGCYIFPGGIN